MKRIRDAVKDLTRTPGVPPERDVGPRLPILNRATAAVIIAVITALGAWGGLSVPVSTDISALLPRDEDQKSLVDIARRAGMMRKVAVVVEAKGDSSGELIHRLGEVRDALAGIEGVERVVTDVDPERMRKTARLLLEHAACLYRPAGEGMTLKQVRTRLFDLKSRLASPEAMMMGRYLLEDPLGFSHSALAELEGSASGLGAQVRSGHLVSQDGRAGLLVVELAFDPMDDVDRSARFAARLDEVLARIGGTDFGITALGGVHFTAANAGVIKSDIVKTFALTALAVVVIFFAFFRRLRLLPAALLPGGIGIAAGVAVMAAAKVELHGLTLGFAATLTGISVDYAIHLLHRARKNAHGAPTEKSMAEAVAAVWRPIALGCLTTTGAFVLVSTSSFPGIRQLALFSAVSVPAAMFATLAILPAFHGLLLGGKKKQPKTAESFRCAMGKTRGGRLSVLAAFAGIAALGLAGATQVSFEGDPARLGAGSPKLEARKEVVAKRFGGVSDQVIVAASGESLAVALERNDALYEALKNAGFTAEQILSVSPFLPSPKAQKSSARRAAALLRGIGPGNRALGEVFEDLGFSGEYVASLPEKMSCDPLEPSAFGDTAFASLISEAVFESENDAVILTRVRAGDRLSAVERIARKLDGAQVVSERMDARRALETLGRELAWMLGLWSVSALVVLALVRRSLGFGLRAVLPAVFGVAVSAGLFGWLDRPFTPVASAALNLVFGLGIDYVIFMQPRVHRERRGFARATLVSALTTLSGFGVLAVAQVRAMADMGLIILTGVGAAVICALVAVPLLDRSPRVMGDRQ